MKLKFRFFDGFFTPDVKISHVLSGPAWPWAGTSYRGPVPVFPTMFSDKWGRNVRFG